MEKSMNEKRMIEKFIEIINLKKKNVIVVVSNKDDACYDTLENSKDIFNSHMDEFINKLGYKKLPSEHPNVIEFENDDSYLKLAYFD